jgi:hypothetical protein
MHSRRFDCGPRQISVEGGGVVKRFVFGFSAGATEMDTVAERCHVTPQGLRNLDQERLAPSEAKPGVVVPTAVVIATGNPICLTVVGGTKIYWEASGRNKLREERRPTPTHIRSSSSELGLQASGPDLIRAVNTPSKIHVDAREETASLLRASVIVGGKNSCRLCARI